MLCSIHSKGDYKHRNNYYIRTVVEKLYLPSRAPFGFVAQEPPGMRPPPLQYT